MNTTHRTAEEQRLHAAGDRSAHWKRWGPYLSERQWGTVREDYSPHGTAWDSTVSVKLRLGNAPPHGECLGAEFDALFAQRLREADEFYATVIPASLDPDGRNVMRQASTGSSTMCSTLPAARPVG